MNAIPRPSHAVAPQPPRTATLLERLQALAQCPRAEGYACITARREHGALAVDVAQPTIAIVLQGAKRVRGAGEALAFAPGDLFLMARRCRLDVVNIPDPRTGLYLTLGVPLCEEAIAAARLLWREPPQAPGPEIARYPAEAFASELARWIDAIQAGRYTEARLALTALAVSLCRLGHGAILAPPPPDLSRRIREMVAARPDHDWQSHDFERALGLSGATLRRRLAAERTRLRDQIAGARLAAALDLLYTTRWPVKTVAARVGYRSVASFARRFAERYGMEPGRIGNA